MTNVDHPLAVLRDELDDLTEKMGKLDREIAPLVERRANIGRLHDETLRAIETLEATPDEPTTAEEEATQDDGVEYDPADGEGRQLKAGDRVRVTSAAADWNGQEAAVVGPSLNSRGWVVKSLGISAARGTFNREDLTFVREDPFAKNRPLILRGNTYLLHKENHEWNGQLVIAHHREQDGSWAVAPKGAPEGRRLFVGEEALA